MNNKNYLVLISGTAASGKSLLLQNLQNYFQAFIYKPSNSYLDIAKKNSIPKKRAFFDVSQQEAEQHFINICKSHDLVIGDQHLAIQYYKDSLLATNNSIDNYNISEEYVSALSKDFINKIIDNNIKILLILLEADIEILQMRSVKRNNETGQILRNYSINEILQEKIAEKNFYDDLINNCNIDGYIINNSLINIEEVTNNVVQKIRKFRR